MNNKILLTRSIKLYEDIFTGVHDNLIKVRGVQLNHMTRILLHTTMTTSLAVDKVDDVIC